MEIVDDLRYGLRALAKNRAFTAAAVLSLALGVGANATIFTLLNGILLRPLPVKDPSMLAAVHTLDSHTPGFLLCSYPNFKDIRDRNSVFSSMLIYTSMTVSLTGRGNTRMLLAQYVSAGYFSVLGVNLAAGREFLPEEDTTPETNPVAVISYALWKRDFAGDPEITSRTITLNRQPYRIVGVAPEGFQGLNEIYGADVWLPSMMHPRISRTSNWVTDRRALLFAAVGRLKAGGGLPQAEAAMKTMARDLAQEYPAENGGRSMHVTPVSDAALASPTRSAVTSAGTVLMIISGLVLLIACANVANLLMAKATGRGREVAIRMAMGAGRGRLVRQFLTESLLLAALGSAAGLGFAVWARNVLWGLRPSTFRYAHISLSLDARVLAYTSAVALLTAVVFGLAPALRASRPDLATELKDRTGQPPAFRGLTARSLLVIAQVALSVVALVGAGLFVRSILNAGRLDLGFDAERLASISYNVADERYTEARGREYQRRALEIAQSTPGVISASLAKDLPLNVSGARTVLLDGPDDPTAGKGRLTWAGVVWPGYFRTLGTAILRGRDFTPADGPDAPRVTIVNETAAALFWPGQNPIGKVMHFAGDSHAAEVVGVVRNSCYRAIGEEPRAMLYMSLVQYYFPMGGVYLRTNGDPEAVGAAVRRALGSLDPNLELQSEGFIRTIRESLWAQRLAATLLAVFGALALLLSAVGIYGVLSYSVSRRVREIGVRMALGASATSVKVMILREGVAMVIAGVLAGTLIALEASQWVAHMLFATGPRDPWTFLLAPPILTAIGAAACWIPARRATRVDPAVALRDE